MSWVGDKPLRDLTNKQKRFAEEYLIDNNATQAAIRAGYAAKDADVQGPRLLGYVGVAEAIKHGQKKIAKKAEITAEMVVAELAKIGFADVFHYCDSALGTASRGENCR